MRGMCAYLFFIIPACNFAQQDSVNIIFPTEFSTRIKVIRLNFNSNKSDFSPVLLNNSLVFASGRENSVGVKYSDVNNIEITDLFYVTRKDSVSFKNANAISGDINTKYSEGPFTISKDGNQIYYTGNEKISSQKIGGNSLLKIYKSQKTNNNVWSKPMLAGFCTSDNSYAHPCFSADEKKIYFSSNLPNGFGGMDIYSSTLKNNEWSKPVNLGPEINSSANEVFPFCSDKNVLYFSSTRSSGMGGLDIYSFDMMDLLKKEPKLLEYPINTVHDDFGIWTDSTGTAGYFSTNRIAAHGDDIYYFASVIPDFSMAAIPVFKNKFCYSFFEETALVTNDTTSLAYEWNFGDGTKSKELRSRHCFNKPGTYQIALNSVEKGTGEVIANEVSYELIIDEPPQLFVSSPDTVKAGCEIIFNSEKCALKGYDLTKTYWYFGDGKYNSGKQVKHIYADAGSFTICMGVLAKNTVTEIIEPFKVEKQITVLK